MSHFAQELREEGFEVDHRVAHSLAAGLRAHCEEFGVDRVVAMEPMSWSGRRMLIDQGVDVVRNDQFLCHYEEFAEWVGDRGSFKMEDFYRRQRLRHDILLEPGENAPQPVGGRWNFDHENREPPPKDGRQWPAVAKFGLDDIDLSIIDGFGGNVWGAEPDGTWPVTRNQALIRLREFIETALAPFGPYEDAMLAEEWKLAHSVLASSLNLGLLHPREVIGAAEDAYDNGAAPIASVEGFIRQVVGWREYVWGVYWLWMPTYRTVNALHAHRPVPPAFLDTDATHMACVASVINHVDVHGYAHHIERLMVLGNLALTAGVEPAAMVEWMWASFVDGAEWVMLPNVIGMALFADGGQMATKPYASGGAYLNKMGNSCKDCRYNPKKRTGDEACPFTTLYWDFLARNEATLAGNHRISRQLAAMRRLSDLPAVRERAQVVLAALDDGTL